jgi:hypothetical protein
MSVFSEQPLDCLVLKIIEFAAVSDKIDNSVFILYDKREHKYIVRGKRVNGINFNSEPYSFVCDYIDVDTLVHFISFITCAESKVTYELHNYDNLPESSHYITYEFLETFLANSYEIAAYDKISYSKSDIKKHLNMLRFIYNDY